MIDALTLSSETDEFEFDHLTLGTFAQGTPDREDDRGGSLDENTLDEETLDN